jgi:16S rRNA pseudouridine516 synthase
MRIDRLLANSGYGTRSEIREIIRDGRVCLSGVPVKDPSVSVEENSSRITIDGTLMTVTRYLYAALYKPEGCLTALEDSRLPTIAQYIPPELLGKGIAPVGRLDYNTSGLLLMTNNGMLSHRLTGPKWHVGKIYLVTYTGEPLTGSEIRLFADGMTLREAGHEPEPLAPAKLEPVSDTRCRLMLTEGKTHQVKRMLAAVGRSVTALHRESIGGITLPETQNPGEFRMLEDREIDMLLRAARLEGTPK